MESVLRLYRGHLLGVCIEVVDTTDGECPNLLARYGSFVRDSDSQDELVATLVVKRNSCQVNVGGRCDTIRLDSGWLNLDMVIQTIVVAHRPDLRFVHASGVWDENGAVLFVGASTSGKSTLALALQEGGYRVLADDLTPLSLLDGKAFPFQTAQSLRPYTRAVAAERNWKEGYVPWPKALKEGSDVQAVFLLKTESDRPTMPVRKASPASDVEWGKLCRLIARPSHCFGHSPTVFPPQRCPEDFAHEPKVTSCPTGQALQSLFNHLHPPRPPLKTLLDEASCFFSNVRFYNLHVGHLDQTVDLVLEILQGHSPL